MKQFFFSFCILCISTGIMAQKLSLNEVVNKAYGSKKVLETDTLLYVLSECSPFIETKPDKKEEIAITVFKKREQLIEQLSEKDAYLLKVGIAEINVGKIVMTIAVYKINNKLFTEKENFLVFHDERTIECILNSKKKWVYSRTLNIKSHLTDK